MMEENKEEVKEVLQLPAEDSNGAPSLESTNENPSTEETKVEQVEEQSEKIET